MSYLKTRTVPEYLLFLREYLKMDPLCIHNSSDIFVEGLPKKVYGRPESNMEIGFCAPYPEVVSFIEKQGFNLETAESEGKNEWRQKITQSGKYRGYLHFRDSAFQKEIFEYSDYPNTAGFWNGIKTGVIGNIGAELLFFGSKKLSEEEKQGILESINGERKIFLPRRRILTLREYVREFNEFPWHARACVEHNLDLLQAIQEVRLPMYYYQPNNPFIWAFQGEIFNRNAATGI
jgi:hypothetical protein